MTIAEFAQAEDWIKFNSSLLIEVTRPKGVFTCTGVAVSKELIVTAAHCLEGDVTKVRVFTQDHYDPSLPSLEIKDFKLHPEYNSRNSQYVNDIAKITMKNSLPNTINIHAIHDQPRIIGNLVRFGFGERNKKNIRTVTTPNLRNVNVNDKIIELNDEYSRSGDSGGPIFLKSGDLVTILAVHSTFSHGPQGNFSLNPLLFPYLPWIYAN